MIPAVLLFSSALVVCAAPQKDTSAEASVEASAETTEMTTEASTEVIKATSGDAWYTTLPGSMDSTPKTLDDIYKVLFWLLVVTVVCVTCMALIFIFNQVM